MKRIGCIAAREFLATVMTRGFVIGVLLLPGADRAVAFTLGPRLMNQRSAQVARPDRDRRSDRPRRARAARGR